MDPCLESVLMHSNMQIVLEDEILLVIDHKKKVINLYYEI